MKSKIKIKNDIVVTTAMELDEIEQADVLSDLRSNFSFEDATFSVDPTILGGVKLAFYDRVIDCSIERKLRQICSSLIKR